MHETLQTRLLEESEWKSSFLIDLKRTDRQIHYLEITQVIRETCERHTLQINPTVLPHLLRTLAEMQAFLPDRPKKSGDFLTEARQKGIEQKYLDGLPVKEIAWQEELPVFKIEQVLYNFGHTPLVKNGFVPPKKTFHNRRNRR